MSNGVAIITGASRGIGRAAAVAFARDGMDIVCAARSTDASPARLPGTIEETVREIQALGRRALAVACDISDEAQVAGLVEQTMSELGRVDLLVNNAAVNTRAPFTETPWKLWELVLRVNLKGTVLCTNAVLPQMIAQGGGRVINVSSGAVVMPEIAAELGVIPYAVSKAAVEKLTEVLAEELRPKGIAVNCLRIESAVATEGARKVGAETEMPSGWIAPEDAANALLWLAHREPSYTGRTVTIAETQRA